MTTETLRSPAYFVSPNGRDSWSGKLAAPNADGTDGPFATLVQARDAMRVSGIATTYVRAGNYMLGSAIQLTAADSNHAFLGYPGETPVISGGEHITGFRDEGGGVFSAAVAGGAVGLDLRIGGERQHAAQSGVRNPDDPTSGFLWADQAAGGASKRAFTFRDGDIKPGDVQAGSKVQVFDRERLTDDIVTVQSVDFATHTVQLASDTWYPLRNGSTFRLLNNAAFLRNTGEFGWRAGDGRLVVKPQDPTAFDQAGVVAARLGTLVDVTGATGITLQGLTFADTTWDGSAAVRLTNATGARIGDNHFLNVGTALSLTGSSQNLIGDNFFDQVGASGITLSAGSNGNRIYANRMEHIGEVAKYVAAISGNGINDNIISNNYIAWSARDGIAIKNWSADTKNTGNVIEYNRILHTGLETADAAAISVLGRSNIDTRMTIRGNRIEDANGVATAADHTWLRDYKGFGVYLDDQTNGVTVTDNFIDNADWAGVFVHGGDNNTVQNNLAVMHGNRQELVRVEWVPLAGDAGTPRNNTITRNIAYGTQAVDDYWELLSANNPTIDGNLVFNSAGYGPGDVIADPRFVDPAHGDWRLAAGSPAGSLGIHDLPWARMGIAGYSADGTVPAFWSAAAAPAPFPLPVESSGGGSVGSGAAAAPTVLQPTAASLVFGDSAANLIPGNAAAQTVAGGDGNDTVMGGDGGDVVCGNQGKDLLLGNAGADTLYGGRGDDVVYGGVEDDRLFGDDGLDRLAGDGGNDTLAGAADSDTLTGGDGSDLLLGNAGADTLYGGRDNDTLFGGLDDDLLSGDDGDDVLTGNAGNDIFVFAPGSGHDTITDFAAGDRIAIAAGMSYTLGSNGAGDAVISFSGSDDVTLTGVRSMPADWLAVL
ncbi:right-handed parallel beta-helix repeat-containing protein [Azospirillum sp. sgz301742]